MRVFIDSNLPMYVAGRPHPLREPSVRLFNRLRDDDDALEGCTSTEVLQEILYRYSALRRLDLAREVYELFVQLCPVVLPVSLADTDRAKQLVCDDSAPVGVRDAIHAAVMLNNGLSLIATFDQGFDRIDGVERLKLD